VNSVAAASILICAAWLPLHAQNYHEDITHGKEALGKGACKVAKDFFQRALNTVTATMGVAPGEELAIRAWLTESAVCVGAYDDALRDAKEAQSLLPTAPEHALILFLEAEAAKAKSQYDDANTNYDAAIRAPLAAPNRARFLAGWGDLARLRGDFAEADERIKQALAAADKPEVRNSLERAYADVVAGDWERERGHFSEARRLYGETLAITKSLGAPKHPLAGKAFAGIGLIELDNDRLDLAELQIKQAEAASHLFPSSDAYLGTADARGLLELAKSDLEEARQDFEDNLKSLKMRGELHPGTAVSMDHLGLVDLAEKPPKVDEAIEQFKRAREIQQRYLGDQHPFLATTLQYLGRAYHIKGNSAEAQKALDEALHIQIAKLDKDSPALAATRFEEASLFAEQDKLAEAESLYRDALLGAPGVARLYANTVRGLALVLHAENKNSEAGNTIAKWMGLRGLKLPLADPERLPVAMATAEICLADKDYSGGESKFKEILAAGDKLDGDQRSKAEMGLAESLFGQQRCQAAESLYASVLPNLPDQPRARAWENLAKCYTAQDQGQKSMEAWQEALRIANKPDFPQAELQRVRLAIVDASLGTGPDEAVLNEWLTTRNKGDSLTPEEVLILGKAAQKLKSANRNVTAERAFKMILDKSKPGDTAAIQTQIDYAEVSARQNKYAQAAEVYERLAFVKQPGMREQARDRVLVGLADIYTHEGRNVEAAQLYEERAHIAAREPADARKYLELAQQSREKAGEENSPSLVPTLLGLGDVYLKQAGNANPNQERLASAKRVFERAKNILETSGQPDDMLLAATFNGLGRIAQAQHAPTEASELYEKADNLVTKRPNPPRAVLAAVLYNRGSLASDNSQPDQASSFFSQCLDLFDKASSPDDPPPLEQLNKIAALEVDRGHVEEAERLYQKSEKLSSSFFGEDSIEHATQLTTLANLYKDKKRYDEAAGLGERALAIFRDKVGPDSIEARNAALSLAVFYRQNKDYNKAVTILEGLLNIQQSVPAADATRVLDDLATTYKDQGAYPKLVETYKTLAKLWQSDGYKNDTYLRAKMNLVVALEDNKNHDEAESLFKEVQKLPKQPGRQAEAQELLRKYSEALRRNGHTAEANRLAKQAKIS
jgi:tetratricopeptide (TPR) repeat protein